MSGTLRLALGAFSLAAAANAQSTVSITPTAQAAQASGVSQYIPPDYAGFGIEPSNMFSFTGEDTANEFSVNLMDNLGKYTGKPGHVRVGGNTQDYFLYQADMNDWTVETNKNSKGQGAIASDSMIIGPRFFEAISRFPKDTPVTMGLNLAYEEDDYLDQISLMASAAINNLTNVDLVSFEIGNEPDLYLQNGFRTGTWDGNTYTTQWKTRAQAVYQRVLQAAGWPVNSFEGPCTASTIGTTFEIKTLVGDGIQKVVSGSSNPYLKAWNQHDYLYFIDVSTFAITLNWMMDLANTESQFAYWKTQVGIALDTGLPYQLREMQSVGPTGLTGVSDTFGAALWNLNFFLYAATLNISAVEMHMTDNSFAAPWQPIVRNGVNKNVRPTYYAYAAMAQLIGSGNGTTQVAPLSNDKVPSAYKDNIRMYAGYGSGDLTSIVVVNSQQANASDSSKGSLSFSVSLPSAKGQTLYISRLTNDGADSTTNTTWNGMSFEKNGDGTSSTVDSNAETVKIGSDGKASFSVRDSEAVIAYIGSQLGSNAVTINGTTTNKDKTSSASSTASSATATIAGIATTGLALMSSVTGSAASASSTSTSGAARAGDRNWSTTLAMAMAMAVGVVLTCFVW